jgi:hypothetical protein
MELQDMILISVDDHVVEPPDMWEGRVPKKFADQVPKIVVQDNGTEAWEYLGRRSTNAGLNAVAGRPPEDYGLDAQAFADMRPGCYEVHQRVRDMSANGVLASLNFPSWAGFAARRTRTWRVPSFGPTTTGTSKAGAASIPTGSSHWGWCRCGTRS